MSFLIAMAGKGGTGKTTVAAMVLRYLVEDCLEKGTGVFREKKWNNQKRFVTQAGAIRVLYGMGEGETLEGRAATKVITGMRFDQDVGGRQAAARQPSAGCTVGD